MEGSHEACFVGNVLKRAVDNGQVHGLPRQVKVALDQLKAIQDHINHVGGSMQILSCAIHKSHIVRPRIAENDGGRSPRQILDQLAGKGETSNGHILVGPASKLYSFS